MDEITFKHFLQVDIRCGTVISAEPFPKAKIPAYIIKADFGPEIGIKKTSARITDLYDEKDLVGRKVMGVINVPKKQIGSIMSEFLILGFSVDGKQHGEIVLAVPDSHVPNGAKLH